MTRKLGILILVGFVFMQLVPVACDDDTDKLGIEVMPKQDEPVVTQAVFEAKSSSWKVDSLVANTSNCYLGRVTDPETGTTTTCNFLAQFYTPEDYKLPSLDAIHKENGKVVCDSVELRLYVQSYYGDSLNSMKIGVYELDREHVMDDNQTYYTNIDASQYLSQSPTALKKTVTFSVSDLSLSDSVRYSSSSSKNILVRLPNEYGQRIMETYYEHPEYFRNSYSFIHHVVPGFYFKVLSGNGTLVNVDVTTLSLYFRYKAEDDSTYVGVQRVAATEEVLQNNYVDNTDLDSLVTNEDYTFLKTPAGIFTEVELPVDSIYFNHQNDSVNSAKVVFKRRNNVATTSYSLKTPNQLLLVRKGDINTFFEKNSLPDSKTSYITTYSSSYNSYTYSNIANLLSVLKRERDEGAGILPTDTPSQIEAKATAWELTHPDWNKVVIIPVSTETSQLGSITSVRNNFELTSTKLVGGANQPIKISVVYSHFND